MAGTPHVTLDFKTSDGLVLAAIKRLSQFDEKPMTRGPESSQIMRRDQETRSTDPRVSANSGTTFCWLFPFDYPLLLYCISVLLFKTEASRINWSVLLEVRYELTYFTFGFLCVSTLLYADGLLLKRMTATDNWRHLYDTFAIVLSSPTRIYEVIRSLLACKICMTVYCHFKQEIPLLNSTTWDRQLEHIDRIVHFGCSPSELCLTVGSIDWLARTIDWLYAVWYLLTPVVLVYFLIHPIRGTRWHFFTCFILLWIIGGSLAICFPSLGPTYVNPTQYTGLNAPTAHSLQHELWIHYQELLTNPAQYNVVNFEGIAAFPSLHVGIVVLYTIALRHSKPVFWMLALYSVIVQVGSVFLGWHYAVDGYFAAILAIAIYALTRPLFRFPTISDQSSTCIHNRAIDTAK